jgi:NADH dehydrogenase (ubiquinone) 1 alpha subcomplex subunit 5
LLTTRFRIDEIEKKIGAGLIEEVLSVAEGELILADEMLRHQVYVNLHSMPTSIADHQ